MNKVMIRWALEYGLGTTDCVDTYCCCLEPAWYVVFEGEEEWEGHYFQVKDCILVD